MARISKINDTTFKAVEFAELSPVVTIGGKDKTKLAPNLNMSFFDDEFYFNLNRKDKIGKTTVSVSAELDGIDTDIWHIDDKGRLKWDIRFDSKPASNVFTWELKHTNGLEFHYQSALTEQEVKEGKKRDDEVVGSYAVYCGKKNNKYKTGKVSHIYRPLCVDAKGLEVYAGLLIEKGTLSITIPQDYIDNCTYPMTLDPTIGYTTAPASWDGATTNALVCSMYYNQAAESGTAQKLYWYARRTTSAQETSIGYYNANGNGTPHNIVSSGTVNITGASGAWYSIDVTGTITSGNNYIPAFLANSRIEPAYDSIGRNDWGYSAQSSFVSDPAITRYYSTAGLYIEYGEASSQSPVPLIMQSMNQFRGGMQ